MIYVKFDFFSTINFLKYIYIKIRVIAVMNGLKKNLFNENINANGIIR